MLSHQPWWTIGLIAILVGITACGIATSPAAVQTVQPATTATKLSTPTPIKVTVEVTRLVTPAVHQNTPAPATPCTLEQISGRAETTIGALLPLSEPGNFLAGFAMQTALNIAVRQINEAGGVSGKQVRLLTYDTAGDPQQAAQYASQLLQNDCAVALIGGYHDSVARAVSEIAHIHDRPFLIVAAMADSLTASEYPQVFRLAPSSSQFAATLPQWLATVGDYNGDGQIFAVQIAEAGRAHPVSAEKYIAAFETLSIRSEILSVDLPSTDFSSVIARIVAFDALPDALFIHVRGEQAYALQTQLLQAGIAPQKSTLIVNHHTVLNHEVFWSQIPNGIGTLVLRMGPWPSTVGEIGAAFADIYRSYLSSWPEFHAFTSYDAMHLVVDAIARSDSLQGDALILALESADITLASGHYYFPFTSSNPPDGDTEQAYMWHQMPDPQILILQYTEDGQTSSYMPIVWPDTYSTVAESLVVPAP